MYIPLHYQVSEYDCVPTSLNNAISYLFHRHEIPPMVIQHIYLYCLDTVGRNARFGVEGTSKYAVRLVGNWLNSYKIKSFSVQTKFLEKEKVCLEKSKKMQMCLRNGGVALCNILLTAREEHYIMIMAVDDEWVYCFDSYRRNYLRGLKGNVIVLDTNEGRKPNLKIRREWFGSTDTRRFCLGPIALRESLLVWRDS